MKQWITPVALLAASLLMLVSCRSMAQPSVSPIGTNGNREALLSEPQLRDKFVLLAGKHKTIAEIRSVLEREGYDVRIRDNGEYWVTKEVPAAFPSPVVYDVKLTDVNGTVQVVNAKVFGKGL